MFCVTARFVVPTIGRPCIIDVFSLVKSKARKSADKQRFLRKIPLVNLGSVHANP